MDSKNKNPKSERFKLRKKTMKDVKTFTIGLHFAATANC